LFLGLQTPGHRL